MDQLKAIVCAMGFACAVAVSPALAEDLDEAWSIALRVNQQLQAEQSESTASALNVKAAKSARLPTVRNFSFNSNLTASPMIRNSAFGTSANGGAAAGVAGTSGQPGLGFGGVPLANTAAVSSLPSSFPVLGKNQTDLPVSVTFATIPLYTGGKILGNIDAAQFNLNNQKTVEFRTALDLKLSVAEAYVGVLRARRNLKVTRSDVERLASFAKDTKNRRKEGLAIRSDELSARVSLGNARIAEIRAKTALESAWATYNRYLCRPLTTVVELNELGELPPGADLDEVAREALLAESEVVVENEDEVTQLTEMAIRSRPELASFAEQAKNLGAQARVTKSGIKPQVSFSMAYAFVGNENQSPQGIGAATFYVDWTLTDGGASRRRAAAYRQQEIAAMRRRADSAADIAREVRSRWLDLRQARQSIPVARVAVAQSEEALKVVKDRYEEQLSTYTEVLDAEARRVQSLTNLYTSFYDEAIALFRLRRAVGNL